MTMDITCCEVPACTTPVLDPDGELIRNADWCVVPELMALWAKGIRTVCSCCGHGEDENAYIRVRAEDADSMLAMGYEPFQTHECFIHENTASFRARHVREIREKGEPKSYLTDEQIRRLWDHQAAWKKKEVDINV